jgi:hypothetical protein
MDMEDSDQLYQYSRKLLMACQDLLLLPGHLLIKTGKEGMELYSLMGERVYIDKIWQGTH